MHKILTSPPSIEPVTLADVKLQLRIDTTDLDALLTTFITNARVYCERITRTAFITQSWLASYDNKDHIFRRREIQLRDGVLQSVQSINTYDQNDNVTLYPSSNYRVAPYRIALLGGQAWPDWSMNLREFDCVQIAYTIGYGNTEASVPPGIINAICQLVGFWYEASAGIAEYLEAGKPQEVPAIIRQSLIPYTQFIL